MDATLPQPAPDPAQSYEFRFSMRAVLVALTAACLVLAPAQWFGGFYLASAGFSIALVLLCSLVYRSSRPATVVIAVLSVPVGLFTAIAIIVFFFHAVANAIACAALAPLKPRPRTFAFALIGVMLAIYSLSFYSGYSELQEMRNLQQKYPFISLANRLTFERPPVGSEDANNPPSLSVQVATNLNAQEQMFQSRMSSFSRAGALQELHENYQAEFSRAAGFGNMRMGSISYRIVDFKPQEHLSLPAAVAVSKVPASNQELYDVHRGAAESFVSTDRIGYVKSRDAVAGFEPHQLAAVGGGSSCSCGAQRYWQVVRLELVGLLQSDEPRVYTAKVLPPMDQISTVPHRPLNDFEFAALPKLAAQEDVVVNQKTNQIQMLGALRASKTCLECHQGQRGKLLGAFSYELTPITDPSETPTEDSQQNSDATATSSMQTSVAKN